MNRKTRLAKLERRHAPQSRLIVLRGGAYVENGKELTAAEYEAIANDPTNDVALFEVEYEAIPSDMNRI